jgi:chromosome segregation ATPase
MRAQRLAADRSLPRTIRSVLSTRAAKKTGNGQHLGNGAAEDGVKLSELSGQIQAAQHELAEIQQAQFAAKAEHDRLQSQIGTAQLALDSVSAERQREEAALAQLRASLTGIQSEVQVATAEKGACARTLTEMQQQILEMDNARRNASGEIARMLDAAREESLQIVSAAQAAALAIRANAEADAREHLQRAEDLLEELTAKAAARIIAALPKAQLQEPALPCSGATGNRQASEGSGRTAPKASRAGNNGASRTSAKRVNRWQAEAEGKGGDDPVWPKGVRLKKTG